MRGRGRSGGGGGIRRNPSLLSDAGDLPASLPNTSSRRRAAQLPLESLGASAPLALLSPVFFFKSGRLRGGDVTLHSQRRLSHYPKSLPPEGKRLD